MDPKLSYPNYSDLEVSLPTYNLSKWMDAMRNIYIKMHLGSSQDDAISTITKGWDKVEKRAFVDWMKYYQAGEHLKYKMAKTAAPTHSYYVGGESSDYFLPNPPNVAVPSPIKSINEQMATMPQQAKDTVQYRMNELPAEDRRRIIEDTRKKILSRLHSAEKLLSSHQGQTFAGTEFEKLLIALYDLKKQIQTVNKVSLSSQLYVDLIIRQANKLSKEGFERPATFLRKFAQQVPGNFNMQFGDTPVGGSIPQGKGNLGNNAPDIFQTPPAGLAPGGQKDDAIGEFLDNLEGYGLTEFNEQDSQDSEDDEVDDSEANDDIVLDEDNVLLEQQIVPEEDIVVEAQLVPPMPPRAPRPAKEPTDQIPERKPAEELPNEGSKAKDVDVLIDSALQNITVQDLIQKLDDVAKVFRNREISRQLSICDIMMDRLGIAGFFGDYGEVVNKSLESTNYILSRLENILSRLRSTVGGSTIDLEERQVPEHEGLRRALEKAENQEKQRKEMRKKMQDDKLQEQLTSQEKPEAEVEGIPEEVAQAPAQIPQAPQAPKAPAPKQPFPLV